MQLARLSLTTLAAAALLLAHPAPAAAFCGFFVSGADAKLVNNATQVVLLREGTRTVLSMQNNYKGPPEDFALVVPVPVVLQEQDVKTLPKSLFDRVDQLAAPRLVEYWEQDPCPPRERRHRSRRFKGYPSESSSPPMEGGGGGYGVTIEAKFEVGEYQILILGAQDSTGLDAWLRDNNYKIPAGAGEVLRPYVQAGMKFFVAKVDAKKVQFGADGQAMLSPLRFHYDSDTFALPVRLGLLNAQGKQDLIVHVLARDRYQVANYPNVAISTNIEVADATRSNFSGFYAALFDRVLERHPGAVITEYAWQSSSCDPCPVEPLQAPEIMLLGGDVAGLADDAPYQLVLTRLHARYGAENLGDDLVFQTGEPIVGGRESGGPGSNEQGATGSSFNNFQARYIIRHPWTGPVKCRNPQFGVWGGPPGNSAISARDTAFVARDAALTGFLKASLADQTALPGAAAPSAAALDAGPPGGGAPPRVSEPSPSGCARCDTTAGGGAMSLGVLALAGLALRRRRR